MITQFDSRATIEHIRLSYETRSLNAIELASPIHYQYQLDVKAEREQLYTRIIQSLPHKAQEMSLMEIGAGSGSNLFHFNNLGFDWSNLYANELLEHRADGMRMTLPTQNIYHCDALDLPFENSFDVVFQSTVFTSILSEPFRIALAKKMWKMLRKDGIILWYDFVFDNPNNPNVRKATRGDVLRYFPQAMDVEFYSTTLAPPIGRRIGNAYQWVNVLFPFLRSHLIAVIHK